MPTNAPSPVLIAITAILLAGYCGIVLWALTSPSSDPQRGMAQGFLSMVLFFLLCLAGLLWFGVHANRRAVVWIVFGICALPSLSLVARGIFLVVRWFNSR